jgi:hypothetical protein
VTSNIILTQCIPNTYDMGPIHVMHESHTVKIHRVYDIQIALLYREYHETF